jgi:hypothetical protein
VGGLVLVILLVGLLALIGIASLVTWIRRAGSCARTIEVPAAEAASVFTGDVLCRYVITSGSLARLEFFDWGVRVRGIAVSRWIVPTWEARYEELAAVELVTLPWSRIAVWLRIRGESARIGFLTQHSRDILGLLEKHDVQVDRSVAKVRRVTELYGPP